MVEENEPNEVLSFLKFDLDNENDNFLVTVSSLVQTNTAATTLSLCGQYESTITINGWTAVFNMLQVNKTIQNLYFYDCLLSIEWVELFVTIVLNNNTTLRALSFADTSNIGINGACIIVDSLCSNPHGCSLTSLTFKQVMEKDSIDIDQKQLAQKLVTLLQQKSTKLVELDLQYNGFNDEFLLTFANGLRYNKYLKYLDFEGNYFTDIGAKALANALYYNSMLLELDLSFNNMIQTDGLIAITTALRYHPSLNKLVIQYDFNETVACVAKAVEFLKYNEVLKTLSFNHGYEHIILSILYLIRYDHRVSVQSMFDYNDTMHYLQLNVETQAFPFIDTLLKTNRSGDHKACKKGVPRRQESYLWLYNSWLSA